MTLTNGWLQKFCRTMPQTFFKLHVLILLWNFATVYYVFLVWPDCEDWWDKSDEAGPKTRKRPQAGGTMPTMQVLCVEDGKLTPLGEIFHRGLGRSFSKFPWPPGCRIPSWSPWDHQVRASRAWWPSSMRRTTFRCWKPLAHLPGNLQVLRRL